MRCVGPVFCLLVIAGCSEPSGSVPTSTPPAQVSAQEALLEPVLPPAGPKPTGTVEERVQSAEELAAKDDLPRAIEKLEEAVLLDAKDRKVLLLLVKYAQSESKTVAQTNPAEAYRLMLKSGGYLRMLREAHPDATDEEKQLTVEVLYNEASAHARSKRVEETLGSLRAAVSAGFQDFDRIRTDADWDSMRELPQFKKAFDELTAARQAR